MTMSRKSIAALKARAQKENRMSRMNGGLPAGTVPILGQQQPQSLGAQMNPGPNAFPIYTPPMNTPQGPVAFAFGGMTKLEYGALLIAGQLRGNADGSPYPATWFAALATDLAQAVLDECAKRQATPQPEPAK